MEQNTETKTLSFSKGMTNIPSDMICEDGELAFSRDFIYRDGEMRPIQRMKSIGIIAGNIMYVHKMADYENIIAYDWSYDASSGYSYTLYIYSSGDLSNPVNKFYGQGQVTDIKSVGNTLVVATSKGIRYILFKGSVYKDLGLDFPTPKVKLMMGGGGNATLGDGTPCNLKEIIDSNNSKRAVYMRDGTFVKTDEASNLSDITETYRVEEYISYNAKNDYDKISAFKDAVQGHAAQSIAIAKQKNYFLFPFFVRYAFRLFDGGYAAISNPIACFPTVNRNCKFVPVYYDETTKRFVETSGVTTYFLMYPMYQKLFFKVSLDGVEEWKDIIKDIVFFASEEVMPFKMDGKWNFTNANDTNGKSYINYLNSRNAIPNPGELIAPSFKYDFDYNKYKARDVLMPTYKSDSDIISELIGKTQYFKLFHIPISSTLYINTIGFLEAPLSDGVVENLTSQEQLPHDDYYGWTRKVARKIYEYNNRVNLFNVERFPFKGFAKFSSEIEENTVRFRFRYFTHIVSPSMDTWVASDVDEAYIPDAANGWLFYPDPNATEMIVWDELSQKGMKVNLQQHQMLNGAYSFNKLPLDNSFVPDDNVKLPTVDPTAHETLDSQIFTSVVNNPFVFESNGDNTVGTGKILGIVANTEAVSQGQFGQFPLLVFTTEGLYAMSVNSEGLYSSIHPISREVCNNADSITPTDKVIYFTSEKGLMATSGGTVVCVSTQLSGGKNNYLPDITLPFKKFLENCMIAYDYKASLLRIFNRSANYHYVYNMIERNLSTASNYTGAKVFCRNVVNNYPDNLVQFTDGTVCSLTDIPQSEEDTNSYEGVFITRPMKFTGSMMLKSLREIRHIMQTAEGKLSLEVLANNNAGSEWCKLMSLGGKPWAYFRFRYTLTGFKASDSFQGSVVTVQNRRSLLRGQN